MVLIHPTLCSKPAACAKLELATGLRADSFITRSGNYVVGLVSPKSVKPFLTPKAKPASHPNPGPFGGNAA